MFGLGSNAEFALIFSRLFFIRAALDVTFSFVGIEEIRVYNAVLSSSETDSKVLNIVHSAGVGIWL